MSIYGYGSWSGYTNLMNIADGYKKQSYIVDELTKASESIRKIMDSIAPHTQLQKESSKIKAIMTAFEGGKHMYQITDSMFPANFMTQYGRIMSAHESVLNITNHLSQTLGPTPDWVIESRRIMDIFKESIAADIEIIREEEKWEELETLEECLADTEEVLTQVQPQMSVKELVVLFHTWTCKIWVNKKFRRYTSRFLLIVGEVLISQALQYIFSPPSTEITINQIHVNTLITVQLPSADDTPLMCVKKKTAVRWYSHPDADIKIYVAKGLSVNVVDEENGYMLAYFIDKKGKYNIGWIDKNELD